MQFLFFSPIISPIQCFNIIISKFLCFFLQTIFVQVWAFQTSSCVRLHCCWWRFSWICCGQPIKWGSPCYSITTWSRRWWNPDIRNSSSCGIDSQFKSGLELQVRNCSVNQSNICNNWGSKINIGATSFSRTCFSQKQHFCQCIILEKIS